MAALIAEGLFRIDDDRVILLGSRQQSSGVVKFPAEQSELFDGEDDIKPIELSTHGTLFTFTTQEFAPPPPYKGKRNSDEFRPYVVGYVELAEGLLVETLIVDAEIEHLHIGQSMRSTTTTLETATGENLLTFAFTPA